MKTARRKINLKLFDGETTPPVTPPASTEWDKVLFESDGKLNKDALKVLQPYIDTEKGKHLKSWQDNNLPKYVEKEKFDQLQTETSTALTKAEINNVLVKEFASSKYPDLLMKEVNFDNIKKTENGIVGLTEEVTRIKTAYADFFVSVPLKKGGDPIPRKANEGTTEEFTVEKLKTMSAKEIADNYDAIMKQGTIK